MGNTNVEFEVLIEDLFNNRDEEMIKKAFYIDDELFEKTLLKIKLTGEYNKEYTVITAGDILKYNRVLVEENKLIILFPYILVVVDLNKDEIIKEIDLDSYELFEIHKFKSGYFVYCEGFNNFLNKNFDIVWSAGCGDIFVNCIIDKQIEVFDNYITVFDWYGVKHFYNEAGEYDTKYYLEYDMNKNPEKIDFSNYRK